MHKFILNWSFTASKPITAQEKLYYLKEIQGYSHFEWTILMSVKEKNKKNFQTQLLTSSAVRYTLINKKRTAILLNTDIHTRGGAEKCSVYTFLKISISVFP